MSDKWKTKWFCHKIQELKNPMYGLAVGITKNPEDAEDAIQNTLMLAYEHLDELSMLEKFKPWIMRILTNECYRILKKRRYHQNIDETYDIADETQDLTEKMTLWELIQRLPPDYRTAILLFYYEGMSIRQIARAMDISEDNAKKRLSRARAKLKVFLEKEEQYETGTENQGGVKKGST